MAQPEPCPGLHAVNQSLGQTRCSWCGWVWLPQQGWVHPDTINDDEPHIIRGDQ